ncbi:MAG: hypothetical protein AAF383_05335 [Cyanobacteria bacterium P01_A01_bin.83]
MKLVQKKIEELYVMKVEYGQIKEYFTKKDHTKRGYGYGFVTRTFDNTIREDKKDVYFHITTIQHDFPDLAQQLNKGWAKDTYFWYLIDTSDRDKVSQVWLDANNIPNCFRDDLIIYIVQLWNSDRELPLWIEQVTIDLLGKARQEELHLIHLCKQKEANDFQQALNEATANDSRQPQKEEDNKHLEFKYLELAERMLDKDFYAGLPEDLVNRVLWVERDIRTNYLSHILGGTNLVIEYRDGRVLGYDWIKRPSLYVAKAICVFEQWGWDRSYYRNYSHFLNYFEACDKSGNNAFTENSLFKIFARKEHYKKPGVFDPFREIWNSSTSTSYLALFSALRRFEDHHILTKEEFMEGLKRNKEAKKRKLQEYKSRKYPRFNGRKSQPI